LEKIRVETESEDGLVKVTSNGNRRIINIEINDELLKEKETFEDMLIVTVNKAIEKSEKINEEEMGRIAGDMIPGLGNFKKK